MFTKVLLVFDRHETAQVVIEFDEELPYDQDIAIRYYRFPIHQLCVLLNDLVSESAHRECKDESLTPTTHDSVSIADMCLFYLPPFLEIPTGKP